MNMTDFADSTAIPSLTRAVIRQMGGWASFKESAPDVANHGIDGGFHGFIYYTDTMQFANKNKDDLDELLSSDAQEFGFDSVPAFIQSFRCVGTDWSQDEIARALYGKKRDHTTVLNAIAWYAAEAVCHNYADMVSA